MARARRWTAQLAVLSKILTRAEDRRGSGSAAAGYSPGIMVTLKTEPKKSRRVLLTLWVVLSLLIVVAFALGFEHWRGQRALKNWKQEMTAKGEVFDVGSVWPPLSLKDAETDERLDRATKKLPMNEFYTYIGDFAPVVSGEGGEFRRGSQEPWPTKRAVNSTNTWQKLDDLLQQSRPALLSLRELMKEPPATRGFDILKHLEGGSYPDYVKVRNGAQVLQAAVMNDLHKGDRDEALQNIITLLAFAKAYEKDPALVTYMIRIAILGLSIDVCWDALQAEGWTEAQLATLQSQCLDPRQVLAGLPRILESERAGRIFEMNWFRSHDYQAWVARHAPVYKGFGCEPPASETAIPVAAWRQCAFHPLWQFAWADQEELAVLRHAQRDIDALRDVAQHQSEQQMGGRMETNHAACQPPKGSWRFYLELPLVDGFADLINPKNTSKKSDAERWCKLNFSKAGATTMGTLTQHEMVITAIALRRYEMRHAKLPENLVALVPEFLPDLPRDFKDGQPLRYRLNSDNTFTLYSVGSDFKDDGGSAAAPTNRVPAPGPVWGGRDWVWPQVERRSEASRVAARP